MQNRSRIMRETTCLSPVFIAGKLVRHASTVGRRLRRHQTPLPRELAPAIGTMSCASRRSANRYEHERPGALIDEDV